MQITVVEKATVTCPNCGAKGTSGPKGTAYCKKCGAALPNPKGKSPSAKKLSGTGNRFNGPKSGGFYPSKKPKGPANDSKDHGGPGINRSQGPQKGGFYPSKDPNDPKGNNPNARSGDKKTPGNGSAQAKPPDTLTPDEKKVYQQAYNKTLAATKDKAAAHKAALAAVKASSASSTSKAGPPPFPPKKGASGGAKTPDKGDSPAKPSDALTPEQKKVYQQAYNKVLAQTKDKAAAAKAGMAAVKASGGGDSPGVKKTEFTIEAEVAKSDDDRMQVFGWAYISEVGGAPVVDHSGEHVPIDELEKGIYKFNMGTRDQGEMHTASGKGTLIESMVFTKEKYEALGIDPDGMPLGAWIGFQMTDPECYAKAKSGEYPMLSIHGKAMRKEIIEPDLTFESGADLVLAAKMEIAQAESAVELSKNALAYLSLAASSVRSDRLEKGVGTNRHGASIKCPDIYEALKREGKSKTTAAQMSNECHQHPTCKCH